MKERRYDVDCTSTHTTHWGHAQTPHPIWVGVFALVCGKGYNSTLWGSSFSSQAF